jgi:hypothetical protein
MKTAVTTLCFVSMVIFLATCPVRAGLLETLSARIEGGSIGKLTTIPVSVSYGEFYVNSYLFFNLPVSINDIGKPFIASSKTSQGFGLFTKALTNGVNEYMTIQMAGSGLGVDDNYWLKAKGDVLKGYQIDHYSLTFNSLTIRIPGSDPAGNGNWTDYSGDFTFNVYGTVPEPATLCIMTLGVGILRRLMKS